MSDEELNEVIKIRDNDAMKMVYYKIRAFEIIKENNIDLGIIKNCVNAYAYNDFKEITETKLIKRKEISKEEFDILKKVL